MSFPSRSKRPVSPATTIVRSVLCAALLSGLADQVQAEPVPQPKLSPGDSWTYRHSTQSGGKLAEARTTVSVDRVESDGVLVTFKSDASPDTARSRLFGLDWSVRRSVNGRETTVNQPLQFPLDVGKAWRIEITEANPSPQKLSETDISPYKIVGWEDIATPAGTFHALKIESDGRWTAEIAPRTLNKATVAREGPAGAAVTEQEIVRGRRVTGRLYKCFWYVPEVKRWVKSIEDSYSADGSLFRGATDQLESYVVGGVKKPLNGPDTAAPGPPAASSKGAI